jgi:hypothetical protein
MARLELLFGTLRGHDPPSSDQEWMAFLDTEVTPRFPEGLTVLTGYGQWRDSSGVIGKDSPKIRVIWYRSTTGADARIEDIRAARFGEQSVLRADGLSCVSF